MVNNKIFENLFVLELANNHWGSLDRGEKIIKEFSRVVKKHNVKASIKLQFRDVGSFIHKDYSDGAKSASFAYSRYIKKTAKTKLSKEDLSTLVNYIKRYGCTSMVTPFDELSVDWCEEMGISIIKIASSDINDWILINRIAKTKKPVIISTGGADEKQIDDVVRYFDNRKIPLGINHCVSKYPSEDDELDLNQIDYLKARYPNNTIGLSTHEYKDWRSSMLISYAKGARTWERHIDIPYGPNECEQKEVSSYCSLPHQIDQWFDAHKKAVEMCGSSPEERRVIGEKESEYLKALYRGLYLKSSLKKGDRISLANLYSAVPFQKEKLQFSSREFIDGEYTLNKNLSKDSPLTTNDVF